MPVNVKSYDDIMHMFKTKLPDNMDTREGTLVHIVMSATAIAMSEVYERLKLIEEDAYAVTAMGNQLDKVAESLGLTRRGETKAVVKIEGNAGLETGKSFTGGDMEYVITAVEDGYYLAECSEAGEAGNEYIGSVLPKEDWYEAGEFAITEIVAAGKEEEDDDELRQRYIARLNCPVCTGNLSYYREALKPISGVGGIKVVPAHEGGGTVKVVITNADYEAADEELVKYVKSVLDPEETSGQGYGIVPIGHSVTVESAEKVDVDVVFEVNGKESTYYNSLVRGGFPYVMKEMNKTWEVNERIELWDHEIESFLKARMGVTDVNVISINGQQNRIVLEENQILGDLTVNGV